MDVKMAFLYSDLKEDINMTQLDGFKIVVKENIVSKLKKFCII